MDRKQFLKKSLQAGLCGCAAASALLAKNSANPRQLQERPDASRPEQEWIRNWKRK